MLKAVQQVGAAERRGWSGRERGAGATGITKTLDTRSNLMRVESASTDLSLRSRWRINFLQTARRPTGNTILQCFGHFRSSNAESLIRLANATLTPRSVVLKILQG